jgi:fructose-1-phosphate kinase PfkB-like protein
LPVKDISEHEQRKKRNHWFDEEYKQQKLKRKNRTRVKMMQRETELITNGYKIKETEARRFIKLTFLNQYRKKKNKK